MTDAADLVRARFRWLDGHADVWALFHDPHALAAVIKALADRGINILAITTSEIKVSVLIDSEYTELAVRTLHTLYGLDRV